MAKAGSPWKPGEENFIRRNYKKLTIKQIAEKLGRPYGGVAWKINQLDLPNEPSYRDLQNKGNTRGSTAGKKVPVRVTTGAVPKIDPTLSSDEPGLFARIKAWWNGR